MSSALKVDGPELIKALAVPFGEAATIGETIDGQRRIYREVFSANSFAQVPDRVPWVRRHDRNNVLGWAKLRVTSKGLEMEAEPLDTGNARDALAEVKSGLLRGISIGFMADPDRDIWTRQAGELPVVKRRGVELIEISLVARGAYDSALVTEVSRVSWQHQESELIMAPYRQAREQQRARNHAESQQLLADMARLAKAAPVPLNEPVPAQNGGGSPDTPRAAQLVTGATVVALGPGVRLTIDAEGYEAVQLAHRYADAVVLALRVKGESLTGDELSQLRTEHRVLATT